MLYWVISVMLALRLRRLIMHAVFRRIQIVFVRMAERVVLELIALSRCLALDLMIRIGLFLAFCRLVRLVVDLCWA